VSPCGWHLIFSATTYANDVTYTWRHKSESVVGVSRNQLNTVGHDAHTCPDSNSAWRSLVHCSTARCHASSVSVPVPCRVSCSEPFLYSNPPSISPYSFACCRAIPGGVII